MILDDLYKIVDSNIPKNILSRKNKLKQWEYGYNKEYDIVIISKDGTLGEIYEIQNLRIGLPKEPDVVNSRSKIKSEQYWERTDLPIQLKKISSFFNWVKKSKEFKEKWIDYIEKQFDYRENGYWFLNNGVKTFIPGNHWMYLQWAEIDVGYPDYREANRIYFIHWSACIADDRCYGNCYLKIRRSGASLMMSSEGVNIGTLAKKSRIGILSKTGDDAKKMFTDKVVPINSGYPFFFTPIMDGMDKPKTELSYRIPASKITKNNMFDEDNEEDSLEGLDTSIDWKSTGNNSYDGEKLLLLIHDESFKWLKPSNLVKNWRVTKTCLRLGRKIIGKCMMGSTCNSSSEGGAEGKSTYLDSNVLIRNANGQTKSGLYSLFIAMEFNMEGFIDRYGFPVVRTPKTPVMGVDGELIHQGAIDYWEAEVDSLKNDSDALNEFYRQYPRNESHAFRDESKNSIFNLTKIYAQIDFNDAFVKEHNITQGSFHWKNGNNNLDESEVIFSPNKGGRFFLSWIPEHGLRNRYQKRNGIYYPMNEYLGAFGLDSYDISGTVGGRGSNGSCHGSTKFNMDKAPSNEFFLEYIARPQTAEIFFEDILMAIVFYGMPILAENNKPRFLYHLKNRGFRGFSMNRPDKTYNKLSKTERELGGIPNSSQDILQSHASAIETYIEQYVGYDYEGKYRDPDEIGYMPFNRTLTDWAKFNITNRTSHDPSISSGLSLMANNKHMFQAPKEESKINLNFARYNNSGTVSKIIYG